LSQPERVIDLSKKVGRIADQKIAMINKVTAETRILALNAMIEASRAGEAGRGFSIVAQEVKHVSERITDISSQLSSELAGSITELTALGDQMVRQMRGERLSDLALNMIEIIDRNLYERSCDVRWWATDAAVVAALGEGDAAAAHAARRLGVILNSYTVYLDLWIADAQGRVVANGRPDRYGRVIGADVSRERWFVEAMATRTGDDYAACDVATEPRLDGAQVATYSAAIREGGEANGRILGALGIHFDWNPQAAAVVNGVRLGAEEKARTRCLLVDAGGRIIAASDGRDLLSGTFALQGNGRGCGHYTDSAGCQVGFALTPGYETYKGLGWYGVIVQTPAAK
jgi:hypothetical protein